MTEENQAPEAPAPATPEAPKYKYFVVPADTIVSEYDSKRDLLKALNAGGVKVRVLRGKEMHTKTKTSLSL